MPPPKPACPICGESDPAQVRKVVVNNRDVFLCQLHATVVSRAKPASIEELKGLIRREREMNGKDRRAPIDRRGTQPDRRVFARPEGRRMGWGRRASDPRD